MCKPETISFYFENLETTAYEALSCLKDDSDDYFLKLLSIMSVTLSKVCYFIVLLLNDENIFKLIHFIKNSLLKLL